MLEIDLILVVGKTKPVRIFFLLGDESVRATSAFATLESAHDSMIHAYRRKDWETAYRELESCRSQAPEIVQYVYELYEQRIADLQATPPGPRRRLTARSERRPRSRPARARAIR